MNVFSSDIEFEDSPSEDVIVNYSADFIEEKNILQCYITVFDLYDDDRKYTLGSINPGSGLGHSHVDIDQILETYEPRFINIMNKFKAKNESWEAFEEFMSSKPYETV